jgi:uncharacterized protein YjbI with pentapeptide repeats
LTDQGIKYAALEILASNCMTLLNASGCLEFTNLDLSHIRVPKAILRGANFQNCNFTGCNLTGADLSNTDLGYCNFKEAYLAQVEFGEYPSLYLD